MLFSKDTWTEGHLLHRAQWAVVRGLPFILSQVEAPLGLGGDGVQRGAASSCHRESSNPWEAASDTADLSVSFQLTVHFTKPGSSMSFGEGLFYTHLESPRLQDPGL